MSPASVLIIDPHPATRDGVAHFLSASPSQGAICGTVSNALEGIAQAVRDRPDLAISEYEGHGMDGIELACELKKHCRNIEVLIYTGTTSAYALRRIFHSKVAGCVLKTESLAELAQALQTMRGHHLFRSRAITERCTEIDRGHALFASLTPCEMKTLRLICTGQSVKEIATSRGVSGKTVGTQCSHIYSKLHVQSAREATTFCYRHGLVEP